MDTGKEKGITGAKYVIGLTGGIGSGKSTLISHLQSLGVVCINCDKLGHKAYLPGSDCLNTIKETFDADGSKKLINDDGTMNRRVLGGIVFADKKDMEKLNKIVWPVIADMAKHEIENIHTQHMAMLQEFKSSSPPSVCVICVEAAVLVEAGWHTELCDAVWAVQVPPSVSQSRIMKRNNLSAEEAMKRVQSQPNNEFRAAAASLVIENSERDVVYAQDQVAKAVQIIRKQHL